MTGRREELRAGLDAVRGRIDAACAAAGRDPAEVTLVVVTKFFPRTDVDVLPPRVGAAQALAEEQARHAADRELMIGEMAHRMKNAFARIGADGRPEIVRGLGGEATVPSVVLFGGLLAMLMVAGVGVVGCRQAVPDAQSVADGLLAEIDVLLEAAKKVR